MKKLFFLKILKFLVVLTFMLVIFNNIAFAANFDVKGTFDGSINANAKASAESVQNVLVDALTAVRIAGMAIAIIMLISVGIKIMVVAPAEKANVKQYAINYVIGAFILLGASGILTIVQGIAKTAFAGDSASE